MPKEEQKLKLNSLDEVTPKQLIVVGHQIEQLKKRDTEGVVELADRFNDVSEVIGNNKASEFWIEDQFRYSRRQTKSARSLYVLNPYKARCIKTTVSPTVPFKIARANEEGIEAVLAKLEAGQKLWVEDVSRILKGDSFETGGASEMVIENLPGVNGLEKYAAHTNKQRLGAHSVTLTLILVIVVKACELMRRIRAIVKKWLQNSVRIHTEGAHNVQKTTIIICESYDHLANLIGALHLETPANKVVWVQILSTLRQLSYLGDVSKEKVPDFLSEEAIPHLQCALALSDGRRKEQSKGNREEVESSQTKNELPGTGSISSRCKDGQRVSAYQSGSQATRVFESNSQQECSMQRRERFLTASAVAVNHMSFGMPRSLR